MKELFDDLRKKAHDSEQQSELLKELLETVPLARQGFNWDNHPGMKGGAGTEARRLADEAAKEQDKP